MKKYSLLSSRVIVPGPLVNMREPLESLSKLNVSTIVNEILSDLPDDGTPF